MSRDSSGLSYPASTTAHWVPSKSSRVGPWPWPAWAPSLLFIHFSIRHSQRVMLGSVRIKRCR